MKIELIDYTKDGINKIAMMARATRGVALMRDWSDKQNKDYVKKLIKWKHFGILEHITFTFHVSEISRVLTHQLVRHRIASYLQMSSRHTFQDSSRDYVTPPSIEATKDAKNPKIYNCWRIYNTHMINAHAAARILMRDGNIPMEDARYLMPDGFYTHISMTMNCRELRHFFELRCDKTAQWEIRNLAKELLKICHDKYPVIFEDLFKKYLEK